ncbi:AraC family transcriptional regulator [Nitratifractor sp.]
MSCKKPTVCRLFDNDGKIYGEFKYNREDFRRFGFHSHPTFSLSAIEEGAIEVRFHDEAPRILRPGAVALYPPDRVHRTALPSSRPLGYYNLHLDPAYCLQRWREQKPDTKDFNMFWQMPVLENRGFFEHFLLLCRLILEEEPPKRIETLLKGLLYDLFDQIHFIRQDTDSIDPLTDSVARFLHERLDDPPGLDEISRHFGYHPDALNRRFKRRFGLSLRAYLIDRRLHRAKTLLLEGEHSVAQVAAETGFYDQSHFVKAFKKAYSLPPKEYR